MQSAPTGFRLLPVGAHRRREQYRFLNFVGCASPTGMVTPGFLPSRDTRKWPRPVSRPVPGLTFSLYIVGEGREQDAEASLRSAHPAHQFIMQQIVSVFLLF
jgi:hypothetical protein